MSCLTIARTAIFTLALLATFDAETTLYATYKSSQLNLYHSLVHFTSFTILSTRTRGTVTRASDRIALSIERTVALLSAAITKATSGTELRAAMTCVADWALTLACKEGLLLRATSHSLVAFCYTSCLSTVARVCVLRVESNARARHHKVHAQCKSLRQRVSFTRKVALRMRSSRERVLDTLFVLRRDLIFTAESRAWQCCRQSDVSAR